MISPQFITDYEPFKCQDEERCAACTICKERDALCNVNSTSGSNNLVEDSPSQPSSETNTPLEE